MVVDEVIGQWITLAGATDVQLEDLARRVRAVSAVRYLEAAAGAAARTVAGRMGIVADDVMAGLYGALAIFLFDRLHLY